MNKICGKCGRAKPIEAFIKNKLCKDGRAGTCRECSNTYVATWKQTHSDRLSADRRKRYAETEGREVKERERRRRERVPLRVQCQRLRSGMAERSKKRRLPFESDVLTVAYLMDRIEKHPNCECCGNPFLIGANCAAKQSVCVSKNGQKSDSSPSIDRIRPDRGYTVKNIAILCWRCNNLKRNSTPSELQMVCDWMRDVWGNEVESDIMLRTA